ncbi:MAG: hypothetical protein ACI39Q_01860 [Wujia sp.]
MKNDEYLSTLSRKKGYRILAWICIIIIVGLIIATLITGITGSPYFMGCLLLCIIVPIFFYVALWLGRVFNSMNPGTKETQDADSKRE